MQSTTSLTPAQCSMSATSKEFTAAEVQRTLRRAFNVGIETDDRLLLDAYGQAVGADVAASDRFDRKAFLSEEDVELEAAEMANATLDAGVCTTDDPEAFKRRFRNSYFDGYISYVEAARKYAGVKF